MAVNQVSLFFYPLCWKQRLRDDPRALTDEGKPVQIVDAVRREDMDGPEVEVEEVTTWLAERGFTPAERGQNSIFQRGNVQSIFGIEQDIEVSISEECKCVTQVYCRFTLPRRTPPPLSEWAEFAASLCEQFGLRLEAEESRTCGAAEFLAAVRGSRNYRDFAAYFGWSLCDEPFRITIHDGVVLIDNFSPEIRTYYADLERELPIVCDAVKRLVEEGRTRFIFDLRTAEPSSAYPIAKWGAMYGAFLRMQRSQPESTAAALAKNIKLVGSGDLLEEIHFYRLDDIFECFVTTEDAKGALLNQSPP